LTYNNIAHTSTKYKPNEALFLKINNEIDVKIIEVIKENTLAAVSRKLEELKLSINDKVYDLSDL